MTVYERMRCDKIFAASIVSQAYNHADYEDDDYDPVCMAVLDQETGLPINTESEPTMQNRYCLYKRETFRFHGFFQRSYTHEGALTVGGFPPGMEAYPVALIESENGSVNWVNASEIMFVGTESEGAHERV